MFDLLVLGSGVAGLTTALRGAAAGMSVLVLTKGELASSATRFAQGGVAAAIAGSDTPEMHLADTLVAGAGSCDVDAVRALVNEGPLRVRELAAMGAAFDTAPGDHGEELLLAREGGHSVARVVHAGGDATGAEIERALVAAVRRSDRMEVREGWFAVDLIVETARCRGIVALDDRGAATDVRASETVLATGGAGQCYAVTTNPLLSTGDGIALALRAGVACADVEFVQFHPTALCLESMPRPLLSEALRGEGAVLRDEHGSAFMVGEHPMADLAPRDVVSLAAARRISASGIDHVWLDATMIERLEERFPTIWAACAESGLDPRREWLPVAPAAHYLSGGVVADLDGATTLPGLWACGEVACSGVHGANRLASNSLLEGLVFGSRVIAAVSEGRDGPRETGAMRGVLGVLGDVGDVVTAASVCRDAEPGVASGDEPLRVAPLAAELGRVQSVMSADAGVERDASGLAHAFAVIAELAPAAARPASVSQTEHEALNVATVAGAIVAAALAREESRGAHTRRDFPERSDRFLGRLVLAGRAEPVFVPLPELATQEGSR